MTALDESQISPTNNYSDSFCGAQNFCSLPVDSEEKTYLFGQKSHVVRSLDRGTARPRLDAEGSYDPDHRKPF